MKDLHSDRVEAEQLNLFELDPELAGDELPEGFPFLVVSQGTAETGK